MDSRYLLIHRVTVRLQLPLPTTRHSRSRNNPVHSAAVTLNSSRKMVYRSESEDALGLLARRRLQSTEILNPSGLAI